VRRLEFEVESGKIISSAVFEPSRTHIFGDRGRTNVLPAVESFTISVPRCDVF
jgi:hypothetical protein